MEDRRSSLTVAEIVRSMTFAERLIYAQQLAVSSLLADLLADRLGRMPIAEAEAFRRSRRSSQLRLAAGFGPMELEELESIAGLTSDQMNRLIDTIEEREMLLRQQSSSAA